MPLTACPFPSTSWGYTYSVFFDGNAFYGVGESVSPVSRPSLSVNASSGCSPFSTTIDGVLTALDNDTTWNGVTAYDIVSGGFTLSQSATADDVTDGLSVLPSVTSPMLTYRGVADDQQGNSWTMSFSSNGGAVPELVCVTDAGFVGYCKVSRIGWFERLVRRADLSSLQWYKETPLSWVCGAYWFFICLEV